MQHDSHAPDLSTDADVAAHAVDRAVAGYIGYRADTGQRLAPLLAADPRFARAYCLKGHLTCYLQAGERSACGGIVAGSAVPAR